MLQVKLRAVWQQWGCYYSPAVGGYKGVTYYSDTPQQASHD